MRDAMGGIFNIAFLAVFITVISGYLAFTVSYSKAFKVKNKVISTLEQYQHNNPAAQSIIDEYIKQIGYNTTTDTTRVTKIKGDNGWQCRKGYCVKWTQDTEGSSAGIPKGYYSVITFVNIDIPIFNKFLPFMEFFQTQGDTMTINATN